MTLSILSAAHLSIVPMVSFCCNWTFCHDQVNGINFVLLLMENIKSIWLDFSDTVISMLKHLLLDSFPSYTMVVETD